MIILFCFRKLTLICGSKTKFLIAMDAGQPIIFVSQAKGRDFTNEWLQVSCKENVETAIT